MEQAASRPVYTRLPNLLTFGRILAVPALVACFLLLKGDVARWTSLAIFIAACVTDFFDGYLARAWKQQSALGRMLDPIADKLLVAVTILLVVADQTVASFSVIAAIIILSREFLVSGLREFLAEFHVAVPVSWLAKWKTAFQMTALGFLLAGSAGDKILPFTTTIGLSLLWLSAILTIYTGYDYLKAGIQHVVDQDE